MLGRATHLSQAASSLSSTLLSFLYFALSRFAQADLQMKDQLSIQLDHAFNTVKTVYGT